VLANEGKAALLLFREPACGDLSAPRNGWSLTFRAQGSTQQYVSSFDNVQRCKKTRLYSLNLLKMVQMRSRGWPYKLPPIFEEFTPLMRQPWPARYKPCSKKVF